MADESASPQLSGEEIARRTRDLYNAIHGPHWIGPLSEAEGAEWAIWVLARSLAPFRPNPPRFLWRGAGNVQGTSHPMLATFAPSAPEFELHGLESVTYVADRKGLPPLSIGIRHTRPPHTAEVFVEEELHGEGREPLAINCTRVDVASPLGFTMYYDPQSGRNGTHPLAVPLGIADTFEDVTTRMGGHLADRLIRHYGLNPVLPT